MELHFYQSVDSTNALAAAAAKAGADEFYTVVAESQTAGRGRMARSFFSPPGGLYMSTVLRPAFPPSDYGRITPMAAVAVHRALCHVTGVCTQIKWVNDLLLEGKKVCGILAESGMDTNGAPFVVLGIGINTAEVDFPPELWHIADFIPCQDKNALIGAVLAELTPYGQILKSGSWLDYYREYAAFLDGEIWVHEQGMTKRGYALDVLPDGALRVDFPSEGVRELRGGEISVRPARNDPNRHNL